MATTATQYYRLHLLGWTQAEIGEAVGLDQRTVSGIFTDKLNWFNLSVKQDFYDKRKKVEDIAEYYHLDIPLTWAILFESKDDIEIHQETGLVTVPTASVKTGGN